MKIRNYIKEVLRTERSEMSSFNPQLLHSIVGLVTESSELLLGLQMYMQEPAKTLIRLNLLEELGDTLWYHVLGVHSINLTDAPTELPTHPVKELEENGLQYYVELCITISTSLLDIYKCKVFYNRPIDMIRVRVCYQSIFIAILAVIRLLGTTLDEVLTMNTAKLRKRYPVEVGYSDDAANKRDFAKEQEALETSCKTNK